MPEGDTVWRSANVLRDALVGRELITCDVRVPRYATVDLSGHPVDSVDSVGKHLLIRAGGAVIHSHLKMEGAWHVYAPGSRWRRPAYQARIVLRNSERSAVGFDLGELDIVATDEEAVGYLGPDLLGPTWDTSTAVANLASQPQRPVGLALLDQRNLAGLGNVYRNEICFLRGVRPTTEVAAAGDLETLVRTAHRVIHANKHRNQRSFTGDLRPGRQFWVYGRERKPCHRCRTVVQTALLGDSATTERNIFWCPNCQH